MDLSGQVFGKLTAVRSLPYTLLNGQRAWECVCSCGNTAVTTEWRLRMGTKKSCGCLRYRPLLKVPCTECGKDYAQRSGAQKFCDECCTHTCTMCGKEYVSRNTGPHKFCSRACKHKLRTGNGGLSRTKFYNTWNTMNQRCTNPNVKAYKHYGARGITVCPQWRASFYCFAFDMGQPEEGMQIERIDNDKGYHPLNCRWATPAEQIAEQFGLTRDYTKYLLRENAPPRSTPGYHKRLPVVAARDIELGRGVWKDNDAL